MNHELLDLVRTVLALQIGEKRVLRERHLDWCTVHRYRDGWTVLKDIVSDQNGCPRAVIGWLFRDSQDMADFLLDDFPPGQLRNFNLVGERL
jgi:hypothetical protein